MPPVSAVLFGKGSLPVALPEGIRVRVVRKPAMPVLENPERAVEQALASPVQALPLKEAARNASSACIAICDITRPVPNGLLLPPLVRQLLEAGIPRERICLLVATGLHRPNLGAELRELVGSDWVLETVRVENHDARDEAGHADLGTTSRGTRIKLDRHFVEADLKIVVGLVEPHFMAGYSGGRKIIAPGIAHADTIRTFHHTAFMEHPCARSCNLDGNPLHGEQLEIVGKLGAVHAVNTVLDEERRLSFVNFGEVAASHGQAVDYVRGYAEVAVPRRYPLVITGSAGHPLDATYYQTVKGIVGALGALEPGGTLLVASQCSEGLGSEEFHRAQQALVRLGAEGFLEECRTRPLADIDEWQTVKLTEALRHGAIHLYAPGLSRAERELTGIVCHESWEGALAAVAGPGIREAAVIPEGPYALPVFRVEASFQALEGGI
jgi:nickel-dependent lactate racemase